MRHIREFLNGLRPGPRPTEPSEHLMSDYILNWEEREDAVENIILCPRCNTQVAVYHGDIVECPAPGASTEAQVRHFIQNFGNSLEVWDVHCPSMPHSPTDREEQQRVRQRRTELAKAGRWGDLARFIRETTPKTK